MVYTPNNCFCFRSSIVFQKIDQPPFSPTHIHFSLSFLPLSLMAAAGGRKGFLFFGGGERVNPSNIITSPDDAGLELEESDVWNSSEAGTTLLSDQPSRKSLKKPTRKPISGVGSIKTTPSVATSLPVNIPDWSRILGEEYKAHKRESEDDVDDDDDEDQDDEYGRLPPHEYLARTRGSSFSVHEGIGRTLKGRDLSRVRNAVWKQTGFED